MATATIYSEGPASVPVKGYLYQMSRPSSDAEQKVTIQRDSVKGRINLDRNAPLYEYNYVGRLTVRYDTHVRVIRICYTSSSHTPEKELIQKIFSLNTEQFESFWNSLDQHAIRYPTLKSIVPAREVASTFCCYSDWAMEKMESLYFALYEPQNLDAMLRPENLPG